MLKGSYVATAAMGQRDKSEGAILSALPNITADLAEEVPCQRAQQPTQ